MYLLFEKKYVEGLSKPLDHPLIAQTKRVLNKYGIDPKDWSVYFTYLTDLLNAKERFSGEELLKRLWAITKSYEIIGANPDVLNEIAYYADVNVDKAYELLDDEDTALAKVLLKIAWQYRNWIDKDSWNKIAEYYDKTPYYAYLSVYTEILKHKPVLFLAFDEGIGNIAHDLSFNENNGTIYGATWQKLKTGKNALYFDGVDDYVKVPDSPSLTITKELTVEFWAYDITEGINHGVVSKGKRLETWFVDAENSKSPKEGWEFFVKTTEGPFYLHAPLGYMNRWIHFVGVAKPLYMAIFIDGIEVARRTDITGDFLTTTNPLIIGSHYDGPYFNGLIAHVSIYNRALSESEIKKIYETTKVLFD